MLKAGVPQRGVRESMANDGYGAAEVDEMIASLLEPPPAPRASLDAQLEQDEPDEWD